MRQHSVRLQRAVVSHVSSSRLALASRRLVPVLIPRLKPLNPKVCCPHHNTFMGPLPLDVPRLGDQARRYQSLDPQTFYFWGS